MRKPILLILVILTALIAAGGYYYWPHFQRSIQGKIPDQEEEAADYAKVKILLAQSKPNDALKIINKYDAVINDKTEQGKKWLDLLLTASEEAPSPQQLLILYQYFPEKITEREKSSLIVADLFLLQNNPQEYEKIRANWQKNSKDTDTWFILDADKYLIEGNRKAAEQLLQTRTLVGKIDSNRLLRLALLSFADNPKSSWDYLTQATLKDPTNPLIRVYRAKVLEAAEKFDLAFAEYISAAQAAPDNILYRDQLADFLRRNHEYQQAIEVWANQLNQTTPNILWLTTWFWNKVAVPANIQWKASSLQDDELKPLLEYFFQLKQEQFWDQAAYDKLEKGPKYLKEQQATFWLRLIQMLKDGNEKEALDLLQFNNFSQDSWSPSLELALRRVLNYRLNGSLIIDTSLLKTQLEQKPQAIVRTAAADIKSEGAWKAEFFEKLTTLAQQEETQGAAFKLPEDLQALLHSPEIYAAIFLTANWVEAGISLHTMPALPSVFPQWVAIAITQGTQILQGIPQALEFANKQVKTPDMRLLTGRLLAEEGKYDEALQEVAPLTQKDDPAGINASLLASLIYIEKKDFSQAKNSIQTQPKLANQLAGQEVLARIALLENNPAEAEKIYRVIASNSAEAKQYLARKAVERQDWETAKKLTEELVVEFPANVELRQILQVILEELKIQKGDQPKEKNEETLPTKLAPPTAPKAKLNSSSLQVKPEEQKKW